MSFKISITATLVSAFGGALCILVATLDQHPIGALCLIGLVLAGGVAFAIARRNGGGDGGKSAIPEPTKPVRRKAS